APVDAELSSYEHREVALLAGMSLISIVCLAVSQVRFVQIAGWLVLLLPALAFTIVYYLLSLITSIGSRNFDVAAHRRMVEEWAPAAYPSVDVLLPICNEGIDVLINTWTHVAEMADHYPGDVLVHVLDDGASAEAEVEAARFGFRYAVRPNRGWLKKSGNLHFGYETSNNTYLVVFDADFCPRPDFLNHLLPYLEDDPELGIVQSPQFFRSSPRQTVMERGAAAVQELFYRMIQVSRDSHGGAICVGSCAVYRRAALDTIGGTALIEHSEDVHTGFDLSRAGWRLRYVPVPLATGLCPEHPDAFLTQQYRWCAGSMSLVASRKFWSTRMPTMTRLCHLSGLCYYLHTAVFVFFAPAIPLVLIIAEPSHVQFANYVLILPSTFYAVVIFPLWNRIRYGPSALMAKYLYGWAHLFAILDIFTGRLRAWQATGSGTVNRDTRRIWIGICAWGVTASVAWVLGAAIRGLQYRPIDWLFMELFGLSYAFVLVMALRARRVSAQS
ncbi:glycosyltransferase family 2 protein, partial [Mycobacterium sp.]|uniref:glycosyltransferase family 2 protein n=1 Tax=Mycobacterium sp. TaxID=1785 RepID=UPI002D15C3DD